MRASMSRRALWRSIYLHNPLADPVRALGATGIRTFGWALSNVAIVRWYRR